MLCALEVAWIMVSDDDECDDDDDEDGDDGSGYEHGYEDWRW